MTDVDKYKQLFIDTGLNFTAVNTIFGVQVITIYAETKNIDFEFDSFGKFLRII